MPRPKSNRIVHQPPLLTAFKPLGMRGPDLNRIPLSLDEYEALRLADFLALSHEEASEEMDISRSTFSRLLESAHKKVATFIINGGLLSIEGGQVHFRQNIIRCEDCGHMFKTNFETEISECPACHSGRITNFAGGFGHGRCCSRG